MRELNIQAARASEAHDDLQDLLQDGDPSELAMTLALSRAQIEMSRLERLSGALSAGYIRAVEVLTEES